MQSAPAIHRVSYANPIPDEFRLMTFLCRPTLVLLAISALGLARPAAAADPVMVSMETTRGTLMLELFPDQSPQSVENFLQYARDGFYDGTIFHRVIPGFMIQGGGFTAEMRKKPVGSPIKNEASNGLKNDHYTLAMARTGDPDSATSQFFINTANNANLNRPQPDGHGYAVFGKVVDGTDVVDSIEQVATGRKSVTGMPGPLSDVPVETITIESVTILSGN